MGAGFKKALLKKRLFCLSCQLPGIWSRLLSGVSLVLILTRILSQVLLFSAFTTELFRVLFGILIFQLIDDKRVAPHDSINLEVLLPYGTLELSNFSSQVIDLSDQLWVLNVFLFQFDLFLLFSLLVRVDCLVQANLQMLPNSVQLSKRTLVFSAKWRRGSI